MSHSLRWFPRLVIGTAAVHIGWGLAFETPLGEIAAAGVVDSITGNVEREYAFWYLVAGAFLLCVGELARWTVRETGRVPVRLGGWLAGVGATGIILMPASGFWLIAGLGVLGLRAARKPGITDERMLQPHLPR